MLFTHNVKNNRKYPIRKYGHSSILLNVPYTYRDFSFAFALLWYERRIYGKNHTQVWKIFHCLNGLITSNIVWKIYEDFFQSVDLNERPETVACGLDRATTLIDRQCKLPISQTRLLGRFSGGICIAVHAHSITRIRLAGSFF